MSLTFEDSRPDAKRVVEGLRDTGYSFHTAVADVVDNSIAAEAENIDLIAKLDFKGNVTLRVYDDGVGISRDGLINALRYGSEERPTKESLGKFGLGLKTASTAFCRRLVVVSRRSPDEPLHMGIWDLDEVPKHGWSVQIGLAQPDYTALFEERLAGKRGTLVIWETVDRLMKQFKNPTGTPARKAFEELIDNETREFRKQGLRQHLAMTFQRFLDPKDTRARNIRMTLNGNPVEAWDPFCEGISLNAGEDNVEVPLQAGTARFRLRAFVLPRKEELPAGVQGEAAKLSNDRQGIYVYRHNRLIHGPDWLGLYTKEPHLTLLRIEFSFDHLLDEAFHIDIKKSRIVLNDGLRDVVFDFVNPRRRIANDAYRKGQRVEITKQAGNAHDVSNRNISLKENQVTQPAVKALDVASQIATLVNRSGEVRLHLKIASSTKNDEVFVQPVDSIDDGLLWEPALIDNHFAVRLNRGHPYYSKVYVPNLKTGVTIQGMDALLWALAIAELNCTNEEMESMFSDLRYDVSKTLKKLVEDLPEPDLNEDEPSGN